ncbi:4066_t:CDS:2 [Ambispora gerdemannii]|uniref:4066_t:CDS:1 n=1 Tax=Ambispora gerdemannii TaxID=144530 RepID=A0A9N9G312_9GLOM|nr:4066_t:CDS:2 [Ambispora gerdemannii]
MDWVPPELLKDTVDKYFFKSMWYDWRLVEFLEFKQDEILAGLSKMSVHHSYKKDLQLILGSETPEDVSFAIMKQLTKKILESDEVKMFWKAITAKKKYMEQLTITRASASFESNVLKTCGKRFNEEIDAVAQQDIKRVELGNDNEYVSTPTRIDNKSEVQIEEIINEEYQKVRIDKEEMEQMAFWTDNKQSNQTKIESFSTSHKPILTPHKFNMISSKVIPGFKSLKSILNIRYPEIANEIETYEQEQKRLISLGTTLTKWLRKTLSSSTLEELHECLIQPLQGECITDREKKLHEIFEITLKEFYIMIKYNPKHTIVRHNSERKFLVERVSTPFKLVEYVFGTITTYWIEKQIMSTKATEFIDDPTGELTSKKVDGLATDITYNIDVMNMELSGGPFQQDRKHTLEDSEKISNTGVNILLMSLRKYLGASIETAKKLKTYNIQIVEDRITLIEVSLYKPQICKEVEVRSAVFPFALSSIGEYMRVFELISYYVNGLLKRQKILQELSNENNGVKEITSEIFLDWWNKTQ